MKRHADSRGGFTLVEMLVSVGLTVMMLAIFAEVFSIATKSMSKMKGVAENDQKARMLNVLIRGDLKSRSYRQVPGEFGIRALDASDNTPSKSPLMTGPCAGYIYIAENNPADGTDDVLQFTVDLKYAPLDIDGSNTRAFGRALQFGNDETPLADGFARDALVHNPGQPVFDDQAGRYSTGQLASDQTGSSQYAEIAYFLRNGNLYRRQMLIRQPVDTTKQDNQPKRADGTDLMPALRLYDAKNGVSPFIWDPFASTGTDATLSSAYGQSKYASFWCDFDYSAIWHGGVTFVGVTSSQNFLNNFSGQWSSLGLPQSRFCFAPNGSGLLGRSFEYASDGTFIGRFTHEETSHFNFPWPGNPGFGPDNIPNNADDDGILTAATSKVINGIVNYNNIPLQGPRVSQDLLVPNVHEFDIKVWDDWATNPITGMTGMFVDIGDQNHAAKYKTSQSTNYGNNNPDTTPDPVTGKPLFRRNVFDTWTTDSANSGDIAPFRNFDNGFDGMPGKAGVDDNGNGKIDLADVDAFGNLLEQGYPGTDDWHDTKAIQIHIRYYDVPTESMRDLTIIESFVE